LRGIRASRPADGPHERWAALSRVQALTSAGLKSMVRVDTEARASVRNSSVARPAVPWTQEREISSEAGAGGEKDDGPPGRADGDGCSCHVAGKAGAPHPGSSSVSPRLASPFEAAAAARSGPISLEFVEHIFQPSRTGRAYITLVEVSCVGVEAECPAPRE
jgi:hypothetical protein